jgi:DNA-binding response OmpR family regulator
MRKKILIIDDEVDFCTIMKGYFGKRNYDVLVAYNIQAGLMLLDEINADILLLDNNLPDGDGWKFAPQIVEKNPRLRIILISAHLHKSDFVSPNENIIVLEKPISLQVLEETLG